MTEARIDTEEKQILVYRLGFECGCLFTIGDRTGMSYCTTHGGLTNWLDDTGERRTPSLVSMLPLKLVYFSFQNSRDEYMGPGIDSVREYRPYRFVPRQEVEKVEP